MHQIRFRAGGGSLQRSSRLPSWFKGPTSKGRGEKETGKEGGEGEEEVGEGQGTGNGREGVEMLGKGRDGREREEEGEEGKESGRGGKKSNNTPSSINSCLRPWSYHTLSLSCAPCVLAYEKWVNVGARQNSGDIAPGSLSYSHTRLQWASLGRWRSVWSWYERRANSHLSCGVNDDIYASPASSSSSSSLAAAALRLRGCIWCKWFALVGRQWRSIRPRWSD